MIKNLYMITGFLGSGKTTFLNEFLKCFKDKRIAMVINEFGSMDVDGSLLEKPDFEVAKISNGSIMCTCKSDQFVEVMTDISKTDVSDVIVETSGISDLSVMGKILETVMKLSKNAYTFRGLITVADCSRIAKTASVSRPVRWQLAYADYILLNKVDLCSNEMIDEVQRFIREINPFSPMERTINCKLSDIQKLTELNPKGFSIGTIQDVTSPWLDKFTIIFKHSINMETLKVLTDFLKDSALRVKGFVKTNQGTYYVDITDQLMNFTSIDNRKESFLVVIYEHLVPLKHLTRKKLIALFGEIASIE